MKRSQLNKIMVEAVSFMDSLHFKLPPFACWTKEDWLTKGPEYAEIRDCMLGWDITDFGSGNFEKVGLLMITLRNGSLHLPGYGKPYAEKIMVVGEKQITPYHFHWKKTEDIIVRGGGNLLVQVYGSTPDEGLSGRPVPVCVDARNYQVEAGTVIRLVPGESITIPAGQYHKFWGEEGHGTVLVGEVSKTNDDNVDNRFLEEKGRFPAIEEDEEPVYYLFNEIPFGF